MAVDTKVVYLKKTDGTSIKAYVVDYLLHKETNKLYVIVTDQSRKNVKGFELVGEKAVVLSAQDSSLFKGYLTNDAFVVKTFSYEDSLSFQLVKEANKKEEAVKVVEEEKIPKETVEIPKDTVENLKEKVIYYVFDNGNLRSYQAFYEEENKKLSEVRFLQSWDEIDHEKVVSIVSSSEHLEPTYVVYDKMNDLKFSPDGTITVLNWVNKNDIKKEPIHIEETSELVVQEKTSLIEDSDQLDFNHIEEPKKERIIFYVYDQNVVKQYEGTAKETTEEQINVEDIKFISKIEGAKNLNVTEFMNGDGIPVGAYFVNHDDYNSFLITKDGKPVPSAILTHFLCKGSIVEDKKIDEDMNENTNKIEPELNKSIGNENIIEIEDNVAKQETERVLMFEGEADQYNNESHYTIWGCFCTVLSKEPLTIVPENGGVKAIIYEDEAAKSMEETCQNYQNLYPSCPVYLLKNAKITNGEQLILNEDQYIRFSPQSNLKTDSLLKNGKKVLTEAEMDQKRKEDLKKFKKKSKSKSTINEKKKPDFSKKANNFSKKEISVETAKKMTLLSESFRKHYMIVSGVNDDIISNIEKMEKLGHTKEQIISELNLPDNMIGAFKMDFPDLKVDNNSPKKTKMIL